MPIKHITAQGIKGDTVFFYLSIGLIGLSLLSSCSALNQVFHSTKITLLWLNGVITCIYLFSLNQLNLPKKSHCIFLIVFFTWSLLNTVLTDNGIIGQAHILFLFTGALVYLFIINLNETQIITLKKLFYSIAVIQCLVVAAQFFDLALLPAALEVQDEANVFGTFGNAEFLSTYLGISILIGFGFLKEGQINSGKTKIPFYISMIMIMFCVILTQGKGTIIILMGIGALKLKIPKKFLAIAATLGTVGFLYFYSSSVNGRVLLWFGAVKTWMDNFWIGAGIRQLENSYVDSLKSIFETFPVVKALLGHHSATVKDAHNMVLDFASSLGFLGAILGVILTVYLVRKLARKPDTYEQILLLTVKAFYTVLLNTASGLILFATVLGVESKSAGRKTQKMNKFLPTALLLFLFAGGFSLYHQLASEVNYNKGMSELAAGRPEVAIKSFQTSNAHAPKWGEPWLSLGHCYFLQKKTDSMESALTKATAYLRNMNGFKISAHMYYYSGMLDEARELYEYIHSVYPDHMTSITRLAEINLSQANFKRAHEYASMVIDHIPRVKSDSDLKNKYSASEIINITGPILYGNN